MTKTSVPVELSEARERFLELVSEIRPELHRYCARLVGSAIDGEDIVQDAMAKAYYAISRSTEIPPLRPWLFRIAHNTAIDFLRRYDQRFVEPHAQPSEDAIVDSGPEPELVRAALSSFLSLPIHQRSAVILKDVLGDSLDEIAETTGTTVPAVKASLSRGRASLRTHATKEPSAWRDRPETSPKDIARLRRYADLFNQRDWDGLRGLLLEECRLDLVSKALRNGKREIEPYFGRLAKEPELSAEVVIVEGRHALGVFRGATDRPAYIVLLDFADDLVSQIRDFRYAPYVVDGLAFERAGT
jgi:RNA polymerase sigma-70 factor (ECF subfamily)